MTIDFIGADPLEMADRMACAARDLTDLAAGKPPDPAALSEAPLLRRWGVIRSSGFVLTGQMFGHPNIIDGHTGITSSVLAINREQGWARTLSRFYLLGSPSLFGLDA